MMKRILVPLNHQSASLMSVDTAAQIASAMDVGVELVYVREPDHSVDAESRIVEARARLADRAVQAVVHRTDGSPPEKIAALAKPTDLVIMRNRARIGSADIHDAVSPTTLGVLKRVTCPVLVCTERRSELARPIFAYNGSRQSRAAITTALAAFAPKLFRQATVLIVTSDEQMADRLFHEIEEVAAQQSVNTDLYYSPGKPSEVILDYLDQTGDKHDVLIMGAFGRSWLREKVFGSTTEGVLRMASLPVLLAH